MFMSVSGGRGFLFGIPLTDNKKLLRNRQHRKCGVSVGGRGFII